MSDVRQLRGRFLLSGKQAHFETMVLASHPDGLRRKIRKFREGLDRGGEQFFVKNSGERRKAALAALDRYFGVEVGLGALTHGTTFGLAQVLGGMRIAPGQEVLTSRNEHPATLETLRFRAQRDGTVSRQVPLFQDSRTATADEILGNLDQEIKPWTRVLTLGWVYSCDGVKLPLKKIADLVERKNVGRVRVEDRLLFVVDGVHGFGIEDTTFPDLGCDFFIAGCHKSIFGPRGTGVICGKREAWAHVVPLTARLAGFNDGPASPHIPGGVRCFEHWWALDQAFDFLTNLRKSDIEAGIHKLAGDFKARAAEVPGVTVVTPTSPDLSSGIVCLDVRDIAPSKVLEHLLAKGVVASESAPDATAGGRTHTRFAVSILNDRGDITRALRALRSVPSTPQPA